MMMAMFPHEKQVAVLKPRIGDCVVDALEKDL